MAYNVNYQQRAGRQTSAGEDKADNSEAASVDNTEDEKTATAGVLEVATTLSGRSNAGKTTSVDSTKQDEVITEEDNIATAGILNEVGTALASRSEDGEDDYSIKTSEGVETTEGGTTGT